MNALWYGILAAMLATYIVLDGRNFGVGILHLIVARTPSERRQVIAAIGPLWSWHEVWLVGVGGVMIMVFPRFMATAFSGYYLALFLVLWCILLRGIAIEVGGHLDDRLWETFWNAIFVGSNLLLATLFGVALGNVVRGAPLAPDGTFYLPFFTDFQVSGHVGLLDWYTLSVAVFAVLTLTAHGATYLAMRTEGPVNGRARALACRLWWVAIPAFLAITFLTWIVRPEPLSGLSSRPLAWVTLSITVVGGLALTIGMRTRREKRALVGSSLLLFGLITTGAALLYPVMLFSTLNPYDRLTAAACAAPDDSLRIAAIWWFPALALAIAYLLVIQRHYSGKVSVSKDNQGLY